MKSRPRAKVTPKNSWRVELRGPERYYAKSFPDETSASLAFDVLEPGPGEICVMQNWAPVARTYVAVFRKKGDP